MSFLSVLKSIAKVGEAVAPAAVGAINPAAGAVTGVIVNAVIKAEQAGGTGASKKQQVMQQLTPVIGPMVASIVQASGSKVNVNNAGVTQATSQIVDGVVALLNALEAPASAAAPTGSAAPAGS